MSDFFFFFNEASLLFTFLFGSATLLTFPVSIVVSSDLPQASTVVHTRQIPRNFQLKLLFGPLFIYCFLCFGDIYIAYLSSICLCIICPSFPMNQVQNSKRGLLCCVPTTDTWRSKPFYTNQDEHAGPNRKAS